MLGEARGWMGDVIFVWEAKGLDLSCNGFLGS